MAVNLRAPCALAALMAQALPEGGPPGADRQHRRINASGASIRIFFSYTLTKAALWTATQTMAQAFAPRLRVNAGGAGSSLS